MANLDVSELQALIAGAGRAGIRNVHFRDYNHRQNEDSDVFYSAQMRDAFAAGGYGNVVLESRALEQGLRDAFIADGLHVVQEDVRHAAIDELIRRHSPENAQLYQTHKQIFMDTLYHFGEEARRQCLVDGSLPPAPTTAQIEAYLRDQHPNAPAGLARAFEQVMPFVMHGAFSPELNRQTIENIRARVSDSPHNNVFLYGALHTAAPDAENHPMDMDAAASFPGYTIAVVEREEDLRTCGDLDSGDRPDFIFFTGAHGGRGRLIDNRSRQEQARLPLEQLQEQGRLALQEPSTEPYTPETDATEADAPTQGRRRRGGFNISGFGIAGGILGGWLASMFGRGPFGLLFMAVGAIGGYFLASRFEQGRSERSEAPAASAALAPEITVSPEASLSQALAFSNSSISVGGITAPQEADQNDPASPAFAPAAVAPAAFLPALR